jgi:phosphoenolpyruvate phosphomutase
MDDMKKTTQIKKILNDRTLDFFLEAHNALSAKIVEEAGFKGIWASGLSLAATFAVRDNNELSWTQSLDVLEFMSEATTIPILFDGDTGYGNFNNVRRLVGKLEKLGIAGVCLEDKVFPKVNSFRTGKNQQLCSIERYRPGFRFLPDRPDRRIHYRRLSGRGFREMPCICRSRCRCCACPF